MNEIPVYTLNKERQRRGRKPFNNLIIRVIHMVEKILSVTMSYLVNFRLIVNLTTPALMLWNEQLPAEKTIRNFYLQVEGHLQNYKEAFADEAVWAVLSTRLSKILEIVSAYSSIRFLNLFIICYLHFLPQYESSECLTMNIEPYIQFQYIIYFLYYHILPFIFYMDNSTLTDRSN